MQHKFFHVISRFTHLSNEINCIDNAFFEEAAKILNVVCASVSDSANVSVFGATLIKFHEHSSPSEATRMMMIKPFLLKALQSTKSSQLDQQLWNHFLSFLDFLSSLNENEHFQTSCSDIVEVMNGFFEYLPPEMYSNVGATLIEICRRSDLVAKNVKNREDVITSALQLFEKSFDGICRFQSLEQIKTISNVYLLRSEDSKSGRESLIGAELSKIICNVLSSTKLATQVAIELFASLCELMNSEDSELREKSAKLMSRVDVSGLMQRVNDAESKVRAESELPQVKEQLQKETHRAENAETQVNQLTQINVQLMNEVEQLRAEREKLERQVAVFSEGSAYM